MSKFNPDLIQKARKGEIAILNDGSADELQSLLKEVWPRDEVIPEGVQKYYVRLNDEKWDGRSYTDLPHHSVKDFFMPDTKDTETAAAISMESLKEPRKFKITRNQMKELYESIPTWQDKIYEWGNEIFFPFETEAQVGETFIQNLLHVSKGLADDLIKSIFPSYFYIPEGEPVLCRDYDDQKWTIGISNGNGGAYTTMGEPGGTFEYKQIIPYTKQPPK